MWSSDGRLLAMNGKGLRGRGGLTAAPAFAGPSCFLRTATALYFGLRVFRARCGIGVKREVGEALQKTVVSVGREGAFRGSGARVRDRIWGVCR